MRSGVQRIAHQLGFGFPLRLEFGTAIVASLAIKPLVIFGRARRIVFDLSAASKSDMDASSLGDVDRISRSPRRIAIGVVVKGAGAPPSPCLAAGDRRSGSSSDRGGRASRPGSRRGRRRKPGCGARSGRNKCRRAARFRRLDRDSRDRERSSFAKPSSILDSTGRRTPVVTADVFVALGGGRRVSARRRRDK